MKISKITEDVNDLFIRTNFYGARDLDLEWDRIRVDSDGYVFVPQGSTFGQTFITMGDVYENGGYDALFIQKLVQVWPYIYNALLDLE